jgi:hypothetical protein
LRDNGESFLEQEDVETSWKSREITELLTHFCNPRGYFEDQEVLPACFAAEWYSKAYSDGGATGISGSSTKFGRTL